MACEQDTVTTIRKYAYANLARCPRRNGEPVAAASSIGVRGSAAVGRVADRSGRVGSAMVERADATIHVQRPAYEENGTSRRTLRGCCVKYSRVKRLGNCFCPCPEPIEPVEELR
jgi:hypothetical protein